MADYATRYPFLLYKPDDGAMPVGFTTERLIIGEADNFAPRITSTRGETDLDSTLHHTFDLTAGFNKLFTEENQNYRVFGHYNELDGTLYPSLSWSTFSTGSSYLGSNAWWSAKCTTHMASYVAFRENGTNKLYRVTASGVTAVTLPAAISGASVEITSLLFHKGYLWVAGENSSNYFNLHRYNIAANTWQDVSGYGVFWFKLRDNLYHINRTSGIYLGSNLESSGSASWTLLKIAGASNPTTDLPVAALDWNGAAWIAKRSGLYRFDGVDVVQIFDFYPQYLTPYNGALYFVTNGYLYRFNGSLLEKIQYFGSADQVTDLQMHLDRLYIMTVPDTATYKFSGSSNDGTVDTRIFEFDGVHFRVIDEVDESAAVFKLASVGNLLLVLLGSSTSTSSGVRYYDFSKRYQATTAGAVKSYIITADYDGDLPNITKLLRRVQVDLDNPASTDQVTLQMQRYLDGDWSSWSSVFTLTPSASSDQANTFTFPLRSDLTTATAATFEKIRLRVSLVPTATGSTASLRSVTLHYTLHPRVRSKVTATFNITGSATFDAKTALDGTANPLTAAEEYYLLRQMFVPSAYGGTLLLGVERARLHTAVTTITQDLIDVTPDFYISFRDAAAANQAYSPMVALVDFTNSKIEVVRVSSIEQQADKSVLHVHYRGDYRTTKQTFTTDTTHVFPVMPIGRQRLISDEIITQPEVIEPDPTITRQIQRRVTIEMTEL